MVIAPEFARATMSFWIDSRAEPFPQRGRAGFDSARGDCGDWDGMGSHCCRGARCFIFAS
jgi:hypothetical protein